MMKSAASEDQIHAGIVEYLTILEKQFKLRFFHIPNGGLRNKREAAKLKRAGVRPGVPDLCVILSTGFTIWLEVKRPNGCLTRAQHQWLMWLGDRHRHKSFVVYDVSEVKEIIDCVS